MEKNFTILKKSDPKDSIVEIEVSISSDLLDTKKKHALEHHAKHIKIPGFREGHVPPDVAEKHLDPHHILEDAAEAAVQEVYADILTESEITPESSPRVSIQKLNAGEPFVCTLSIALRPEMKLPDYKKIAKKTKKELDEITVGEEEVNSLITSLLESQKKEDGTIPELTEEFIKGFGTFENIEDFKKNVRETLSKDKARMQEQKQLQQLSKALLEETKITLPSLIIEDELEGAIRRLQENLQASNTQVDAFLKSVGKTEEEYIKGMRASIEEQLKLKYILSEIAQKEQIFPDEKKVSEEIGHILHQYNHLSPERVEKYVKETLAERDVSDFLKKAEF